MMRSRKMLKSVGEKGQPSRTPTVVWNHSPTGNFKPGGAHTSPDGHLPVDPNPHGNSCTACTTRRTTSVNRNGAENAKTCEWTRVRMC
ncbi:hypothetical protein LSAT2_009291 [Lamellibrachia satsuma]|nr:hypothetical protein LSAT2_009291 [Lamellibrachia satsuma]